MPIMTTETPSTLLRYLPALYHEDPVVGSFLSAFEKILIGRDDTVAYPYEGLEETIADLSAIFDPYRTPEEFLNWLAGWAALSLRADLSVEQQRNFIANVIGLYKGRGTKENLRTLLEIFTFTAGTTKKITITELFQEAFQIEDNSTIGVDTYIGGGPPHFFRVTIELARATSAVQIRQQKIAHALIDMEKPAHTSYILEPIYPSMQIGVYSTIGVDTQLGMVVTV